MAKTSKVKWSVGADEPEDLQEFLSNDDIEEKHGRPPRGNYTLQVKRITVREIKSGDNAGGDRLNLMLTINEPAKSDKNVFNSYLVWDGMNVTEQGKPFIKRFLKALGLSWDDFYSKSKQNDEDPPVITQIGGVKFNGTKPVNVRATLKVRNNRNTDEPEVVVGRYLPAEDDDDDDVEDEVEEEATSLDEDEPDEDEDESEDEDDEDSDEDEDEDAWTREDLEDEDLDDIKQVAKEDFGLKAKDLKGKDKEALLDLLFPTDGEDEDEDEEDEDDDDEPDEDEVEELTAELNGLKIAQLRKRALRNDKKVDLDGMKKKDLVHLILEQELNVPPF